MHHSSPARTHEETHTHRVRTAFSKRQRPTPFFFTYLSIDGPPRTCVRTRECDSEERNQSTRLNQCEHPSMDTQSSVFGFKTRTKHPRVRTPTRADGADDPTRDDRRAWRQIETRDASSVVVARLDSIAFSDVGRYPRGVFRTEGTGTRTVRAKTPKTGEGCCGVCEICISFFFHFIHLEPLTRVAR